MHEWINSPQTFMGASNSRRFGWLRNRSLAVLQRFRISDSTSWIRFPLFFLTSKSLSIKPSNPSITLRFSSLLFYCKISLLSSILFYCKVSLPRLKLINAKNMFFHALPLILSKQIFPKQTNFEDRYIWALRKHIFLLSIWLFSMAQKLRS